MDREIERAIKKLVSMYGELETKLLIEIAENFNYNESFTNADYWRLDKLNKLGALNKKTIQYLSQITEKTPKEIMKAMKKIGYMSFDENTLNKAFDKGLISINPEDLNTRFIDRAILDSYNSLTDTFITISERVKEGVRKTYLDIVDKAYIEISGGISYQTSIRNAIDELSNKGIKTVSYVTDKGIRNYNIEGVVRREVLTATRQLNSRVAMESIQELGVKRILLSEHLDCRPTHYDWQGTIINVEDIVEITGYGEVTGLGGINCRHYFKPYFGDKENDDLKKYSKEECMEAYKISQKQRYLERGIRKWKNSKEMFKANEDKEMSKYANKKVKVWSDRLDTFTKENNRNRDFTREYIS